jgi:hypothetical protein
VLAGIRDVLFVFAIYSYFAGWVYAYRLYSHFGLSLNAVEIPAYYFFVYAYFMLPSASWLMIIGSIIAFVLFSVLGPLVHRWMVTRSRIAWMMVGIVFGLLPMLFWVAREQSLQAAIRMRTGYANANRFLFTHDAENR